MRNVHMELISISASGNRVVCLKNPLIRLYVFTVPCLLSICLAHICSCFNFVMITFTSSLVYRIQISVFNGKCSKVILFIS